MRRFFGLLFIIVLFHGLSSCNTTKKASEETVATLSPESKIREAVNYIANDTAFTERLKDYYPELKECNKLNFEANNQISPVSIKYFRKNQLLKTSFFEKHKMLNDSEFEKVKESYDSINHFNGYNVRLNGETTNDNCKIELMFSREGNNLLPIKFKIIDKEVDPKINYIPRTGYYLIEYSGSGKIQHRFYIIKSN